MLRTRIRLHEFQFVMRRNNAYWQTGRDLKEKDCGIAPTVLLVHKVIGARRSELNVGRRRARPQLKSALYYSCGRPGFGFEFFSYTLKSVIQSDSFFNNGLWPTGS
jgi:hypothetical protein